MQRPESARPARAYAAYAKRLDGRVVVRRFDPRNDSYDTLTALLHRAFAPLGALGFNCPCVDQPASATRERVLTGECFVALGNAHLVATMTMRSHDPDSRCDPYRSRHVATLGQLAVDPVWQDRGIGRSLLAFAQRRAAARRAAPPAGDAPAPAGRRPRRDAPGARRTLRGGPAHRFLSSRRISTGRRDALSGAQLRQHDPVQIGLRHERSHRCR